MAKFNLVIPGTGKQYRIERNKTWQQIQRIARNKQFNLSMYISANTGETVYYPVTFPNEPQDVQKHLELRRVEATVLESIVALYNQIADGNAEQLLSESDPTPPMVLRKEEGERDEENRKVVLRKLMKMFGNVGSVQERNV